MTRPAFDPSVYESAELAELNRPLHDLAWDMIEAEREVNALTKANASRPVWDEAFDKMIAARKAHAEALDDLDAKVAAYCERAEAAGDQAPEYHDEQIALI